jgi:hypothetical protein
VSTRGTSKYNGCYGLEVQGSIPRISAFCNVRKATAGNRSFVCYDVGAVRRSGREADHSSVSAAYVSECGCISFRLEGVMLIQM